MNRVYLRRTDSACRCSCGSGELAVVNGAHILDIEEESHAFIEDYFSQ